jgi:ABC-type Fe3+-hydroxamate transport system substrate-binding protein
MVTIVLGRHHENWAKLLRGTTALILIAGALPWSQQPAVAAETVVKDFRGHEVATSAKPKRIVALMPSIAEMLVELGAGGALVGAPDYARLPAPLEKKVIKLGPYNRVSAEAVYALHPDLVIASMDGNDATAVIQMEKLGLKTLSLNTQSLDDIMRSAELMAIALGQPHHPRVGELRKTLTQGTGRPTGHRVFVQVGWDPIVTVAQKTFIDELITRAGGENVFHDAAMKYPKPNPEEVISRNPDTIVICQLTEDGEEARRAKEYWMRFKRLAAVQQGRVQVFPVDHLTKPGFELIRGYNDLRNAFK